MLSIYIIIVCALLYAYFTRNFTHWKKKGAQYIKPLPIVGNFLKEILMRQNVSQTFDDLYHQVSDPFAGFFIFNTPCLLIRDPDLARSVLVTDFQHFIDRNMANNMRDDPIGTCILFLLRNPEWKEVRTKISPLFSSAKIRTMSKLMEEVSIQMVEYLKAETEIRPEIDIKSVCYKYTVDSVSSTVFGIDAFSFKNQDSDFYMTAKRMSNWNDFLTAFSMRCYFIAPSLVKLFRLTFLNPACVGFLKTCFLDVMKKRTLSKIVRQDLVHLLLQMKDKEIQSMDENILVAQAVGFFLAGFETTGSVTSFMLFELAHHPEIQTKLRNEINKVFIKYGKINFDSISEMEYLDMCLKEALRKYPVIPFLARETTSTYTIPGSDVVVDKGTPVFIPVFSLNNDPQYFPQPHVFDPERFSKANENLIQMSAYMPFGTGPRNCLGMRYANVNAKFALANILKNFLVETLPDTSKSIQFQPCSVLLSSKMSITLKLTRINY